MMRNVPPAAFPHRVSPRSVLGMAFAAAFVMLGCAAMGAEQAAPSTPPPASPGAAPAAANQPNQANQANQAGGVATGSSGCTLACAKILGCAGVNDTSEQQSCVQKCASGTPDEAELQNVGRMSCDQAVQWLQTKTQASGSAGNAAARPAGACNADCRTCVGDGTSCWAAAGGSHGIPCDACCCAPGGPAPVWR